MKENEVFGILGILWVRAMFSVPSNVLLTDLTEFMHRHSLLCHMIKKWSGGGFGVFVSFVFYKLGKIRMSVTGRTDYSLP